VNHAMTDDIKVALGGPNNDRVKTLFAAIRDQLQKNDFVGATKNINVLEPLVKPGKTAAQPQTAADLMARLNGMKAEIKTAMAGPNGPKIQPLVAAVTGQIDKEELANAAKGLSELEKLIKGAKGDGPAQKDAAAQKVDLETALAAWTTARMAALGQLAKLAAAIKASGHPKAAEGFQLIELIIKKNVTQRPATANQVKELRHYIETEEVFVDAEKPNPFKLAVKVRQPLIDAVAELQKHVV